MRILVIEDEKELLQDIAKGLSLKGYAVDQADNGRPGCQMAIDEAYDLVVLDLNLPEMDGFSIDIFVSSSSISGTMGVERVLQKCQN